MFFDLALAATVLAFIHVTLYFFFGTDHMRTIGAVSSWLATALFTVSFFIRWAETGMFPTATLADTLALLCLALIVVYLTVYAKYQRPTIGMFVFPVIIIAGLASYAVRGLPVHRMEEFASIWLYIHLPCTIIGTAFFVVAPITGIMYFIQERQLRMKNFGAIFRGFPPLDVINRLNSLALMAGFYCYTIGLVAGIFWMEYVPGERHIEFLPKLITGLFTWVVFGIIIYLKKTRGLTPRSTALASIIGFASVIITYLGVAEFLIG